MQKVELTEAYFNGAISVERTEKGLHPWRLPHTRRHLFPSPDDNLMDKAARPSGVRLRMETNAEQVTLTFAPLAEAPEVAIGGHVFDAVIDNEIVQSVPCGKGCERAVFDQCGSGLRVLEVWLPPGARVWVRSLEISDSAAVRPMPDRRPLWVTWGSSLTHCTRAHSAARVWPATVARRYDLNLVNLGFAGQCHLDPMVAMLIRDLPARYISMKLGINALGANVGPRTYAALVTAAVAIVREKHPHTPLALISPMASPPREATQSNTGLTLEAMRVQMKAVHTALTGAGDLNLYYISGKDFFGEEDIHRYAAEDLLHPNGDGIDLQADRFCDLVMPLLTGRK